MKIIEYRVQVKDEAFVDILAEDIKDAIYDIEDPDIIDVTYEIRDDYQEDSSFKSE